MTKRPNVPENELDKMQKQFDAFDNQVKSMTMDKMNEAPLQEFEPQVKKSSQELAAANVVYLKPRRALSSKEKFNEDYRKQYEEAKERVDFIAENKEIIGESIEIWTKPFAGMPVEEWVVPVNKTVNGPKYLRDQIMRCTYHQLYMDNKPTFSDGGSQFYGNLVAEREVPRLHAYTPSSKQNFFMGARSK